MNDAGVSNSPTPARPFDVTDEQLSAELKKWTGTTPALQPVGELLDRHWEAAFAYARLCTDGPRPAGMLTTAAFTRLFGESLRQTGPTSAWRPHLLVTVRRIAAEWDNDGRQELLHPELRTAPGGAERAAARLLPRPDRRLLSRAFQRLPQSARCLLWHTEVEAEPLEIPAGLLGLDAEDARVERERARERVREECLHVHRELAPDLECQRYIRLLDVTYRRGGVDIDPDLARHLTRCKHCRHTADQLGHFNEGLGLALAEAVLGWGAQAYLEARAGVTDDNGVPAAPPQPPAFVGEVFASASPTGAELVHVSHGSRRAALKAARRVRRRKLAVAVLTVSGMIVLPLVLWSALDSGDGTTPVATGSASDEPVSEAGSSTDNPSWIGAGETTQGTLSGRLHNVASGLCIGVVGGKAVKGAETELTACSSAAGQQWSYETDGLLRNVAEPDLCLDSHLGFEVQLAPCTGASSAGAKNIRYDFTLQGALVPRWDQDLALAPAATDGEGALVLKTRDDGTAQRWVIDTSKPDLQLEMVNWGADTNSSTPTPTPKSSPTPSATPTPSTTPSATPTASSSYPDSDACYYYPYYCSGDGDHDGSGGYDGGYGGGWGHGGYGGGR